MFAINHSMNARLSLESCKRNLRCDSLLGRDLTRQLQNKQCGTTMMIGFAPLIQIAGIGRVVSSPYQRFVVVTNPVYHADSLAHRFLHVSVTIALTLPPFPLLYTGHSIMIQMHSRISKSNPYCNVFQLTTFALIMHECMSRLYVKGMNRVCKTLHR